MLNPRLMGGQEVQHDVECLHCQFERSRERLSLRIHLDFSFYFAQEDISCDM